MISIILARKTKIKNKASLNKTSKLKTKALDLILSDLGITEITGMTVQPNEADNKFELVLI